MANEKQIVVLAARAKRRAGQQLSQGKNTFAESVFNSTQLQQLQGDPDLQVQVVDVPQKPAAGK